jgi:hypothetical protein
MTSYELRAVKEKETIKGSQSTEEKEKKKKRKEN